MPKRQVCLRHVSDEFRANNLRVQSRAVFSLCVTCVFGWYQTCIAIIIIMQQQQHHHRAHHRQHRVESTQQHVAGLAPKIRIRFSV